MPSGKSVGRHARLNSSRVPGFNLRVVIQTKAWSSSIGLPFRGESAPAAVPHGALLPLGYLPSHLLTFPGLAATHFWPALSGSRWSPAIHFATVSWSRFVQLNRLRTGYAGEPLFANFALKTLFRTILSYAHLYFATLPPDFASSWQPLNRFGSSTSESWYCVFRYCGVYQ